MPCASGWLANISARVWLPAGLHMQFHAEVPPDDSTRLGFPGGQRSIHCTGIAQPTVDARGVLKFPTAYSTRPATPGSTVR
jgi:hypothetical protein